MLSFFDGLTLELVPHCASVRPDGWTGDHDVRPLTELGQRQANALAAAMAAPGLDGIYSSPALRCLQTIQPLASAVGLTITTLADLRDTDEFAEPREWTQGTFQPIGQAVGGGWAAGSALRALAVIASRHPRGRAAAASHGDVIPAFLAMLCAAGGVRVPGWPGRGGWYTLRFGDGSVSITATASAARPGRLDEPGHQDELGDAGQRS